MFLLADRPRRSTSSESTEVEPLIKASEASCPVVARNPPFLTAFASENPIPRLTLDDVGYLTSGGYREWIDSILSLSSSSKNILPPEFNEVTDYFVNQNHYKLLYAGLSEEYEWKTNKECSRWVKEPSASDPFRFKKQAEALVGTNHILTDPGNSRKIIASGQGRFNFAFLHYGFGPLVNSWVMSHNDEVLLKLVIEAQKQAEAALGNQAKDARSPGCGCPQYPKEKILDHIGLRNVSFPSPPLTQNLESLENSVENIRLASLNHSLSIINIFNSLNRVVSRVDGILSKLDEPLISSSLHTIAPLVPTTVRPPGVVTQSTNSPGDLKTRPTFPPCLPGANHSCSAETTPSNVPDSATPLSGGDFDGSGHEDPVSSRSARTLRSHLLNPSSTNFVLLSGRANRDLASITRTVNSLLSEVFAVKSSLKKAGQPVLLPTEAPPSTPDLPPYSFCNCTSPSEFFDENKSAILISSLVASIFSIAWTLFSCIAYVRKHWICNLSMVQPPKQQKFLLVPPDPPSKTLPFSRYQSPNLYRSNLKRVQFNSTATPPSPEEDIRRGVRLDQDTTL